MSKNQRFSRFTKSSSYVILHDEGYIEIERLSPPNEKSMGMHRASAWLTGGIFLDCYDFRSVSGKEKALRKLKRKLKEAIENGNKM
tara:strand:- start:58 stop:315 length:258 start_codon:yes stop_codon:yes gene_type:complete